MKAIINYFKQRRERKLRKWCIEQSRYNNVIGADHVRSAQRLYEWIEIH